jgi:hypothetical protein
MRMSLVPVSCLKMRVAGDGRDQSACEFRDPKEVRILELLTLLYLKVLFVFPDIAAAKSFSHGIYPSSGYLELSIVPDASSASH